MPKYATPREVADHFRRSTRTISRWKEKGWFPHVKPLPGNRYLIPWADVYALEERFLREGKTPRDE